jgi:hypothetical protein
MFDFDEKMDTQIELNGVVYAFDGVCDFTLADYDSSAEFWSFKGNVYEMNEGNPVEMTEEMLAALAAHLNNSDWLADVTRQFLDNLADDWED